MKRKNAELTTQQLVMIIILIISFVVILFLIFRLNLGETSNKEICHNSVILKSKGKGLVGDLDCKTNYVCISGGGKCEGINPTETIKVNFENKEEIMKAIADEMADCWWMFGEGELGYIGVFEGGLVRRKTVCAICSIIKFDEKIQEAQKQGISYKEFIDFLANETRNKNERDTYLHYLYEIYEVKDLLDKFKIIKEDYETERLIPFDRKYVIRTGQSTSPKVVEALKGIGRKIISIFSKENKEIKVAIIFPYFFDVERDIEPRCDEFVTKA
ncbi:hypothetical protein DRN69_08995 [Candidatus Pacearchaeota archaeon]|nr:MAG: hypothetical protein DRN69_08995 [Candidatus Pacearchaeota archaeon]